MSILFAPYWWGTGHERDQIVFSYSRLSLYFCCNKCILLFSSDFQVYAILCDWRPLQNMKSGRRWLIMIIQRNSLIIFRYLWVIFVLLTLFMSYEAVEIFVDLMNENVKSFWLNTDTQGTPNADFINSQLFLNICFLRVLQNEPDKNNSSEGGLLSRRFNRIVLGTGERKSVFHDVHQNAPSPDRTWVLLQSGINRLWLLHESSHPQTIKLNS